MLIKLIFCSTFTSELILNGDSSTWTSDSKIRASQDLQQSIKALSRRNNQETEKICTFLERPGGDPFLPPPPGLTCRSTVAALWADNIAANATKRYILAGPADSPLGLWVGQTMAAVFLPSAPAEAAGKAAGMRLHLDFTLGKHATICFNMNGRTAQYLLPSIYMTISNLEGNCVQVSQGKRFQWITLWHFFHDEAHFRSRLLITEILL